MSSLSSISDHLGLAAPFMLEGRSIIQSLCHQNLHWNEQIPNKIESHREAWKSNPLLLEDIKAERCFKPKKFVKFREYSLHHFSDASEYGYDKYSYFQMVDKNNQIHCSLVIGKSRNVPLKYISIWN